MGENKQLRAAGYCRTSGEGQRDNTSIPRQKAAIEATCKANGWKLTKHYVDECKSGAKTEGRDQFKAMLADAAKGEFELVVPYDATRLARDGVDIVSTAKFLKSEFGIHVVDGKNQFDNRDHRNALRNFVQAGVSEHERLTIMERNLGGRIAKAKEGLPWSGNPPYGREFAKSCDCSKKCKHPGKWVISDKGRDFATLLKRYIAGESMIELAGEYRFPNQAAVLRIIREGQLAARPYVVTFNTPEIGINKVQVEVPVIPQVITEDLFKRVRARLDNNRTWNKQCLKKYLLSGFICCGSCGRSLTSYSSEGVTYYRHHYCVKDDRSRYCGFRSVRGDIVEGPVMDFLYRWFVDQPAFDLALTLALPPESERSEREEEVRRVEVNLKKAEEGIARLVDAITKGADPELFIDKQQQLKTERDNLRNRMKEVQGELSSLPDPDALREEAEVMRGMLADDHIGKDWRKESFDDIQRFLRFLFSDHPKREGLGLYIRFANGQWTCEIRARLRLRGFEYQLSDNGFAHIVGLQDGEEVVLEPALHPVNLMGITDSRRGRGQGPSKRLRS